MLVQLFSEVAEDAVQLCTPVLVVVGLHTVAVQLLPMLAPTGVQVSTPVGPVRIVVVQMVSTQLLANDSATGVHVATPFGPTTA